MTKAEKRKYDRLAGKYRLLAGELLFNDANRVPANVSTDLRAAHDALWGAIRKLEELAGGVTVPQDYKEIPEKVLEVLGRIYLAGQQMNHFAPDSNEYLVARFNLKDAITEADDMDAGQWFE